MLDGLYITSITKDKNPLLIKTWLLVIHHVLLFLFVEDSFFFLLIPEGKAIHSMVAHLDAVTCLAVDPNGLYLMSGSESSTTTPMFLAPDHMT